MDPNALAGLLGGGLLVATIGLTWGIILWARGTRGAELEILDEQLGDMRATLDSERRRERIRAAGAAADYQRAITLAAAAAAGDLDGVLRQFPSGDDAPAADESGGEADRNDTEDLHG